MGQWDSEYLDKRVRTQSPLPTNQDQIWTALQEEWANIDEDYIEKLYESMPDRVACAFEGKRVLDKILGQFISYIF